MGNAFIGALLGLVFALLTFFVGSIGINVLELSMPTVVTLIALAIILGALAGYLEGHKPKDGTEGTTEEGPK